MSIDLEAIKARAERATKGPWTADGRQIVIRAGNQVWHLAHVRDHNLVGPLGVRSIVNAEFIAAARDDVPALVAEVERLRAWNGQAQIELDADHAEIGRLSALLEANTQLLREIADMQLGREAFMPVKHIEQARRLLDALSSPVSLSEPSGGLV